MNYDQNQIQYVLFSIKLTLTKIFTIVLYVRDNTCLNTVPINISENVKVNVLNKSFYRSTTLSRKTRLYNYLIYIIIYYKLETDMHGLFLTSLKQI